jgi:hypothetical protein
MLREPIEFSLWDASYNGFLPELKRVVNRCSFAVDNVSIRALDEESPVCLASRHSHWFRFCPMRNYSSTFLRSLRSRPITALPRYYGRSDSCSPGSSASSGMNTVSIGQQVSLVHTVRPSMHSVTKHLTRPVFASVLPTQRDRLPDLRSAGFAPSVIRSGLRPLSAGSSQRAAESCSSSYGLHVRLWLLSTPSYGDAVTFGYRERASPGGGLSPPRSHLLPGARIPAFAGMTALSLHCDAVSSGGEGGEGTNVKELNAFL